MDPALTIGIVGVASMAFGLVRQWIGRPIGFGVFVAVAVGACALSIAALKADPDNPLPLIGGAASGIAFMGVGALIKTEDRIHGFSTAGTIWAMAVFGACAGLGQHEVAGAVYATVWSVVAIDRVLHFTGTGPYRRMLVVELQGLVDAATVEAELLGGRRAALLELRVDRAASTSRLTWRIEGAAPSLAQLEKKLREDARVLRFELDA